MEPVMRHIEADIANELDLLAQSLIKNKQQLTQLKAEKEDLEDRVHELLNDGERYLTDSGDVIQVTQPSIRTSLDSKKVKKTYPEIFAECCKTTVAKSSIKVTPGK